MTRLYLLCLVVLISPTHVLATPMVILGTHDLLPNTADQKIAVHVSGGDLIQGLTFRVQVADGGPDPPINGTIDGPNITSVDLVTDTIFAGNHSGQVSVLNLPQMWVQTITTDAQTAPNDKVSADGLLATITVDTTGFASSEYGLFIGETLDGSTDFAGIPIDIVDGFIRVVPEPNSFFLFGGLLMFFTHVRKARRRMRAGVA